MGLYLRASAIFLCLHTPAQPPSEPFFAQMLQTIRTAQKIPYLMRFLVARMLFNDGLITLFAFGGMITDKLGVPKTIRLSFGGSL